MTTDQTTADQTALRDRIADAIREHYLSSNRDEADADRNMPCVCGGWREPGAEADDENDWDTHLADAVLAVLPPPADQAAIFREAADELGRMDYDTYRDAWNGGVMDGAALLRRMADEQPAEAQPPRHRWYVETLDYIANEWAPGTRLVNRAHAVERLQMANKTAPTWKDGPPVQRRLVRETTTFTVEAAAERQDGAQP